MRLHHIALVRDLIGHMDELVARYTSILRKHRSDIYHYGDNV